MRLLIALVVSMLVLSSCTKTEPAPSGPTYPSVPLGSTGSISVPTSQMAGASYTARGTEPFWNVEVTPATAILTRPSASGSEEVTSTKYETEQSDKGSIISVRGIKGDFFMTITKGRCDDGMSDTKYAYSATVNVGAEELKGCASKKN